MKKNTILLSLIIALILTLSGCRVDFDSDDPQSETDNMKTITIGALLPLTGTWSEPGQGAKKALDVTLSMVNYFLEPSEQKFELDIRDTQSNGEKALQ
ncbi:ABC transporter substrate-binding protein, partial [Desulfobacter sp.]|uniref:ABC transporter substrate-binding protein n=1 Tax=Desulfobacter sp. TaxID=2294 RepID=UPI003D133B49